MRLLNGDCLVEMAKIPDNSIDAIICDPPYGTTYCKWDTIIPLDKMWEQLTRIITSNGAIVLFGSQPFTSKLISSNYEMFKYCWIWDKKRPSNFFQAKFAPLNDTEDICVFSMGGVNNNAKNIMFYNPQGIKPLNKIQKNSKSVGGGVGNEHSPTYHSRASYLQEFTNYPKKTISILGDKNLIHPTQKPVELMEYLVKTYTHESQTVLDFTMGSGTTGIACINSNRNFIGIELDDNYFKMAKNRLTTHVKNDKVTGLSQFMRNQ